MSCLGIAVVSLSLKMRPVAPVSPDATDMQIEAAAVIPKQRTLTLALPVGLAPVAQAASAATRSPFPKRNETMTALPSLSAKSALIADWRTGAVLGEKDSDAILPLASLTKLMTVLIFLEQQPNFQEWVTLQLEDERDGGKFYFPRGEKLKIEDLFASSLIASVNNAVMALARSTNLPISDFVGLMNQKAQVLEMLNSHFEEPTGLAAENIGTSRDLLKLLEEVFQNQKIRHYTSKASYEVNSWRGVSYVVENTNNLAPFFGNGKFGYQVLASKTGYLEESGYHLAMLMQRSDGVQLVFIILGSTSKEERAADAKKLLQWVAENYQWE